MKPLVWCSYVDDILMMRENGKEELQKFLDALNCYLYYKVYSRILQGTNKFSKCYFYENGLSMSAYRFVSRISLQKSIPFSKTLRLKIIHFKNTFFDKRCIDLEAWIKERRYSDKLVREEILQARKFSRAEVSNEQKCIRNERRFVLLYHISSLVFKT